MSKALLALFLMVTAKSTFAQPNAPTVDSNQYKTLITELTALKIKSDSLGHKLNYILNNDYKSLDVINGVSAYYENAWSKLLFVISTLGAITGILLPVYLSRLQRKELQLNQTEFKEYVDKQVLGMEAKIVEFNNEVIKKTKSD